MRELTYTNCKHGRALLKCERGGELMDMRDVAAVGEHGPLCAVCLPLVRAEVARALAARASAGFGDTL